jgi:anti-sigma regulatory factor (Ser/Thr protein kinase)
VKICLDLRLPRDAASVPVIRRLLDSSLGVLGVDGPIREDIRLMLTEACSNVIRHAEHSDDYTVRAAIIDDRCLIKVLDTGTGFPDRPIPQQPAGETADDPSAMPEHGRGLNIIRALADDYRFTSLPENGALVTLEKHLEYDKDADGAALFQH